MVRKGEMKAQTWITAYEDCNVDTGLATRPAGQGADRQGHVGHARPDGRHARAEDRPPQGRRQHRLGALADRRHAARAALPPGRRVRAAGRDRQARPRARSTTSCTIPLAPRHRTGPTRRSARSSTTTASRILGYVVRWIDQGVGCSKVPDIHDVALMEDRATLRISSQLLANWLRHGIVTESRGRRPALERMAPVVDRQNAGDPTYRPMARTSTPTSRSRPPRTSSSRAPSSPTATPSRSCTAAAGSTRPRTPDM